MNHPLRAQENVPVGGNAVAAGTVVALEITQPISSATAKRGDMFAIRLAMPVEAAGKIVIPAGIVGEGQVVHAAKAGGAGKSGELTLAARYLTFGEQRLPLRGFQFGTMTGKDRYGLAAASLIVAGPLTFLVRGGNIDVPAGTNATAKLAQPVAHPVQEVVQPEANRSTQTGEARP
jgi:hypothetical protein